MSQQDDDDKNNGNNNNHNDNDHNVEYLYPPAALMANQDGFLQFHHAVMHASVCNKKLEAIYNTHQAVVQVQVSLNYPCSHMDAATLACIV